MIPTESFLDIHVESLRKHGEELCGDTVRVVKTPSQTIGVLSDGLGSGVKANILATLTSQILVRMLQAEVPLRDVIDTVVGTLPICKVRRIAYATFTVVRINHERNHFRIINFDNPPPFYFRRGTLVRMPIEKEVILERRIQFSEGELDRGDFLGIMSDGVLHAGMGVERGFGWGWEEIARFLQQQLMLHGHGVRPVVQKMISETSRRYRAAPGDDATFLGITARRREAAIIFTGPPLDSSRDEEYVQRVLAFQGRIIVCGGTTANIVAHCLGEPVDLDLKSARADVPPMGRLSQVDLVTEGILTMSRALEYLKASAGALYRLPADRDGARMLAEEILRADFVFFLVGQRINEVYQNPLLPKSISIRRNLVEELAQLIRGMNKEVVIEYC
ncbi:MAG: SpoIIE family protein phosphatase [Isosphaeraceae bacterium]